VITAIQVVTVYVSDKDKALDFYVDKLGFEKRSDTPFGQGMRWLEVAPSGGHTTITLAKGYGGDDGQARVGTFTGIVFDVEDIQGTYETLRSRGVQFTEVPAMQPWGMYQAQFVDVDNNGYVMVQR
jgi:catechol 2,3-dioxygenase-like lactoylglutathione lyase family enzyme